MRICVLRPACAATLHTFALLTHATARIAYPSYEYLFTTRDRLKRYQSKTACVGDDFEQFAERAQALAKERFHDAVLVDQVCHAMARVMRAGLHSLVSLLLSRRPWYTAFSACRSRTSLSSGASCWSSCSNISLRT